MATASKSQLAKLFHRLATSYTAGLEIRSIIERESQSGPPSWRRVMGEVSRELSGGTGLATALRNQGRFFPKLTLAVVQAGEQGGRMDEAFGKLARHYDSLVQFRNRFLAAIAWPVFELVAAVAMIGLMILVVGFINDSIGDVGPTEGPLIDLFGLGLGTAGNFALYLFVVLVLSTGAAVFFVGIQRGWFGTLPMRIARRIPLIGPTIEALSLSRFAWTASIAENAGMEAGESMNLSLQSTQNYYYDRLIPEVTAGVRSGGQFYEVLQKTGAFPREFLLLVENGEISGQMAEAMDRASIHLQDQAETNLKVIATVGFVLTFSFVAIVVGVMVIYLFQKVYLQPLQSFM